MCINLRITKSQIELYLKIEKKHDRKNFPYTVYGVSWFEASQFYTSC